MTPRARRRPHRRGGIVGAADVPLGAVAGEQLTFGESVTPALRQPLAIRVWMAPGINPDLPALWVWEEITDWVMFDPGLDIIRGQLNEQVSTRPSTLNMRLKNYLIPEAVGVYAVDAPFSVRNPNSPWYGRLRKNTAIRVEINPGIGWRNRFIGLVPDWPARKDRSGNFKYIDLQVAGRLRVYGQGSSPVRSYATAVLSRYQPQASVSSTFYSPVLGWWSLEDSNGSGVAASNLVGVSDMTETVTGGVNFAGGTAPLCSSASPDLTLGGLRGQPLLPTSATTAWSFTMLVKIASGASVDSVVDIYTTGTITKVTIGITPSGVTIYATNNSTITTSVTTTTNFADGEWYRLWVNATGGFVSVVIGTESSGVPVFIGGATPGDITEFIINPTTAVGLESASQAYVIGGVTTILSNTITAADAGTSASERFASVAAFEGIPASVSALGYYGQSSTAMGPYPIRSKVAALASPVDSDDGFLVERLSGEVGFEADYDRSNAAVQLTLDYSLGQLQNLIPVDDDFQARNDWTVGRESGVTKSFADRDGVRGIEAIGQYDDSATVSLYTDTQPQYVAAHRVRRGTVDEDRFTSIGIELHKAQNAALIPQILNVRQVAVTASVTLSGLTSTISLGASTIGQRRGDILGTRVQILSPPHDVTPDTIDQLILGYRETINPFQWSISLQTIPYAPFRKFEVSPDADPGTDQAEDEVLIYAASLGPNPENRADFRNAYLRDGGEFLGFVVPDDGTCTLAEGLDETETDIDITTTSGLWDTTSYSYEPNGITAHIRDANGGIGEQIRIDGCSGAGNPQTLTVVRGVNGYVTTHAVGEEIVIDYPGIVGPTGWGGP